MKFIRTEKAPIPVGHYSQATVTGGLVFVSGQLPIDAVSGKIPDTIEEQADQAVTNIENILSAAGSSLQQVVKATIFISDISMFSKVNEIYARRFGDHRPARAMVPSRDLPFGCFIEIEAMAEVS